MIDQVNRLVKVRVEELERKIRSIETFTMY